MRVLLYVVLFIAAVLGLAWIAGPREPVDTQITFNPNDIGEDLDQHLSDFEAQFPDVTPGVEKRVVWAGAAGETTPDVILYLHGFSATSEEIRPVPDNVANALGANLLFWRLPGHGRNGEAMAEPAAGDWINSTAHALEVAERLGDNVIVMATSTGATLAAIAAATPELGDKMDRLIMVSPNFAINDPAARVLTWPLARHWVPLVAGVERSFEPRNERNAQFWTTSYPTVATVPLGALVAHARNLDYSNVDTPVLMVFSDDDQVVSQSASRAVMENWGGAVTLAPQSVGADDDPNSHVIAGDIMSPSMTAPTSELIVDWLNK